MANFTCPMETGVVEEAGICRSPCDRLVLHGPSIDTITFEDARRITLKIGKPGFQNKAATSKWRDNR
jgi:hypothetical protein